MNVGVARDALHSTASRVLRIGNGVLHDEAALRPHRHDDCVLHHLRLDQAEHLGTEVLPPIGPSQPAARDRPKRR